MEAVSKLVQYHHTNLIQKQTQSQKHKSKFSFKENIQQYKSKKIMILS